MSKELHHLFKAIKEHRQEQVKVALKNNQALANAKDDKEYTALVVAAEFGTTGIIDDLLKHGAHINYQTPPHHYTPLIIAARSGNFEIVKYLLKHGAHIQLVDDQGKDALWHAQHTNQLDIVKLLQESKG